MPPGAFPIEGDLAESWQQVNDTTYVVQAEEGRALPRQAARQRPRADGGGRPLHLRAHPDREGQRRRLDVPVDRQGRGRRPLHREVHPEGALRLVPRHDRQSHDRRHHRARVRGEVRRPQEAGGGDRHRALDARRLQAQPVPHPGAQPELLRGRAAAHRPGRDGHRRGQRLPHRRVPGRQVRSRLGEPGDHQPLGLGADRRDAEDAPARPQGRGVHLERGERRRSCGPTSRPSTTSGCARPSRSPWIARASSTRRWRAWGRSTGRCRRRSPTGPCPSPSWARARSTIATTRPRPSGSSPRPATRRASRPASASRPTARPSSWTRCSSS